MKKNLFFILVAMLVSTSIAIGQYVPGTNPNGSNSSRGVLANGLTEIFSVSGLYTLSADGGGSNSAYTVDVNKPAGATVYKAYLMGASTGFTNYVIPDGCVTLNGTPISWDDSNVSGISSWNDYADVTALVAGVIDPAGAGITSLPVTECSYGSVEGVALLVVFSDPSTFTKTIVIMWGALSTTGDNFSLTLGTPIDPIDPGAVLDMGIGISFGYQSPAQYSIIDINGVRLTTSAGGQDDGASSNGALITVGGIGDLNTNPPNPMSLPTGSPTWRYDDELYSLLPFITNTTTNILVNTLNPSNDDNIFLSYFEISGVAIIGE